MDSHAQAFQPALLEEGMCELMGARPRWVLALNQRPIDRMPPKLLWMKLLFPIYLSPRHKSCSMIGDVSCGTSIVRVLYPLCSRYHVRFYLSDRMISPGFAPSEYHHLDFPRCYTPFISFRSLGSHILHKCSSIITRANEFYKF